MNVQQLHHALVTLREAAANYKAAVSLRDHWQAEFLGNVEVWRKAGKTGKWKLTPDLTASWYALRASETLLQFWAEQHMKAFSEMNSKLIIVGQMLGSPLPDEFRPDNSQPNLL